MAIKTYKPTTKSRRHISNVLYKAVLTAGKPVKALTFGRKRAVGRNNAGRITVRHSVRDTKDCSEMLISNMTKLVYLLRLSQ